MNLKKTKNTLIAVIIFLVLSIAVICFYKATKEKSFFDYLSVNELRDIGIKEGFDGVYRKDNIKQFGYLGVLEYYDDENDITSISFVTSLKNDSKDLKQTVDEFVKAYSKDLGLEIIENPIVVQFTDEEIYKLRPSDDYEALANNYVLFEYSYRDKNGVLWIVQIYSPKENTLVGRVTKYVNEYGFEGYEPQIKMKGK